MTAIPDLNRKAIEDGAQIISYAPEGALSLTYREFAQGWVDVYNKMAVDPEVQLPAFRLVGTTPEPVPGTGDVTAEEFLIGHVQSVGDIEISMVVVKDIGGRRIRAMCRPPLGDELERCCIPAH